MTASELRDLIIRRLAREHAGGTAGWRRVIGEIKVYPRSTHAHCNWEARPTGSVREVDAIERMVDRIRLAHPFVE
jgi:hypothetical protein